jgi:tRNA(Ile)-lysidine synthase
VTDTSTTIHAAAQRMLEEHVPGGAPLAVALSGGRDSVVLLAALAQVAPARGHRLAALHVDHGLSPNAGAWARFCADICAERGVPLVVRAIAVPRGPQTSLEAEARRLRYAALADAAEELDVRFVALAHHRDDQAETLLLQLLRGAGPQGLAGMAAARTDPDGMTWLRPFLAIPRERIDAHARAAGLAWVEDESNARGRHLRNALRHSVMPALADLFPAHGVTLARAASHQAEAARLADDLAALDARAACDGPMLDRAALHGLPDHRARNLLRWFLRRRGLPAPSAARLDAMLLQLRDARADARVRLVHAGVEIGVHQGWVVVHSAPPPPFDVPWHGESAVPLPHGLLVFGQAHGAGLDAGRLAGAPVRVRARAGGERFQIAPDRPRRALKSILRDAGIPAWERNGLPLVYCGDTLAAVAGLGIDPAFCAAPGNPGVTIAWHPNAA